MENFNTQLMSFKPERAIVIDGDEIHNFIIELCFRRFNPTYEVEVMRKTANFNSLYKLEDYPVIIIQYDPADEDKKLLNILSELYQTEKAFPVISYLNYPEYVQRVCKDYNLPLSFQKPFTREKAGTILQSHLKSMQEIVGV